MAPRGTEDEYSTSKETHKSPACSAKEFGLYPICRGKPEDGDDPCLCSLWEHKTLREL